MRLDAVCPLAVLLCLGAAVGQEDPTGRIDGSQINSVIRDLAEKTLGTSHIQKQFNDLHFTQTASGDGQELLDELAGSISENFKETFSAATKLSRAIEAEYSNISTWGTYTAVNLESDISNQQCCKTDDSDYEQSDFGVKVDLRSTCFRFSSDTDDGAEIPSSTSTGILKTMQDNQFDPRLRKFIKRQFFGSKKGLEVTYPRLRDQSCHSVQNDPRFQSWYVESATPYLKDLVILMDKSSSMSEELPISKEAVKVVLSTLNREDRVAVIAFSSNTYTPANTTRSCYGRKLAFASRENKKHISDWVQDLSVQEGGRSNFRNALNKAFDFFNLSPYTGNNQRPRRKLILFLTDGLPGDTRQDGREILNILREKNAPLNNSVIVFTYGIGDELDENAKIVLEKMANQTNYDPQAGEVVRGKFTLVSDKTKLRSTMGTYYDSIAHNITDSDPVVTAPYVDFTGLGLSASVCLPVTPAGVFQGVACIDLSLTDIFADIMGLRHGRIQYAFITDDKGQAILHPLLPDAITYGETVYLDITELEPAAGVQGILQSMKRGDADSQTVSGTLIKARGNTSTDGVLTINKEMTYNWTKIQMTMFRLCVVTTEDNKEIDITNTLYSEAFIYHRLLFVNGTTVNRCRAAERVSIRTNSVVKLTESAFKNRLTYLSQQDDASTVKKYTVYMQDKEEYPDDDIKELTKKMIAVSERLEDVWINTSAYELYAVWRYYGDYYGSIRIYPGLTLAKAYDPTKRSWFVKAVSQPTKITLTAPYLDAFGAGIVVTLSFPICMGSLRPGGSCGMDDLILGVAGMDFKLSFIKYMIESNFDACTEDGNKCFLVDSSGYIVYHPDIQYGSNVSSEVEGFHITEVEPGIAEYLRKQSYLTNEYCVDFGAKRQLYTWRLSVPFGILKYETTENIPHFDLLRVHDTNVFLGIRKRQQEVVSCDCPTRDVKNYSPIDVCTNLPGTRCQCPCYKNSDYDYCLNTYGQVSDSYTTCVPQPASIGYVKPIPNEAKIVRGFPPCRDFRCNDRDTESLCEAILGCHWCDDNKCMDLDTECPGDQPPTNGPVGKTSSTIITVVVVVVGVVVVAVIVLVVLAKQGKLACRSAGKTPETDRYIPDDRSSIYEEAPNSRDSVKIAAIDLHGTNARPDVTDHGERYIDHNDPAAANGVVAAPADSDYLNSGGLQQDNPAFF